MSPTFVSLTNSRKKTDTSRTTATSKIRVGGMHCVSCPRPLTVKPVIARPRPVYPGAACSATLHRTLSIAHQSTSLVCRSYIRRTISIVLASRKARGVPLIGYEKYESRSPGGAHHKALQQMRAGGTSSCQAVIVRFDILLLLLLAPPYPVPSASTDVADLNLVRSQLSVPSVVRTLVSRTPHSLTACRTLQAAR